MTNLRANLEEELVEYLANCSNSETVIETLDWVLLSSKQKELIEHALGIADRELPKASEEEFPRLFEKLTNDILEICGVKTQAEEIAFSLYPCKLVIRWDSIGVAYQIDGNEDLRNGFIAGYNYPKLEV